VWVYGCMGERLVWVKMCCEEEMLCFGGELEAKVGAAGAHESWFATSLPSIWAATLACPRLIAALAETLSVSAGIFGYIIVAAIILKAVAKRQAHFSQPEQSLSNHISAALKSVVIIKPM
jgi:hypothetical protein